MSEEGRGWQEARGACCRPRTIGLSYRGKDCILAMAAVALAVSPKTTQACPRRGLLRQCTMSTTRPKGEKVTYRAFFKGAFFTFSVRFCTYNV